MLWGIDLGGTKIEGVVFDPEREESRLRLRCETQAEKGYDAILFRIKELIERLKQESGLSPRAIGFGTPGALDEHSSTMKQCNTTCLNGRPLKRDLEVLCKLPVEIANDANCFALAENLLGAGRGASSVFGVIMGTGVGGGVVIGGKLVAGAHGLAGEWGHSVLVPDGETCYCGKRGCVETIISGPALERHYHSLTGTKKSLSEISAAAREGEGAARDSISRLCRRFGEAISVVVNILDPEVIVLGGGVSNVPELYQEGVAEFRKMYSQYEMRTKIVRNELGDSAGVVGAALLTKHL